MIRVMIAEYSPDIMDGLSRLLQAQSDISIVAAVYNGLDARAKAEELRPDVAIMDAQMPCVSKGEAIQLLKQASPETGVLFFSISSDCVEESVAAGCHGYVTKDSDPQRLFDEVRRIASRGGDSKGRSPAETGGQNI